MIEFLTGNNCIDPSGECEQPEAEPCCDQTLRGLRIHISLISVTPFSKFLAIFLQGEKAVGIGFGVAVSDCFCIFTGYCAGHPDGEWLLQHL